MGSRITVERILWLRRGIVDEMIVERMDKEVTNFDFIDNFLFRMDFIMQPITRIALSDYFGQLAANVSNVASSTIDWNFNALFNLLQNIFESIVTGWKQTLFTAFIDRNLRLAVFNQVIMKYFEQLLNDIATSFNGVKESYINSIENVINKINETFS
jgi:hypothetical protein